MAQESDLDDLDLKPAEAGAAFKVEMWTTNFLLGYWKHLVAVGVVGLLTILFWGQYDDWYRHEQRTTTSQVADALGELQANLVEIPERKLAGEVFDAAAIAEVGETVLAIANGGRGAARVEAYLTAAELFRLAAQPERQKVALEGATAGAKGALEFAAQEALANLELEQGQGDSAVARLRALSTGTGYLAEQASIDLALALEHLGRSEEAASVYVDFLVRFPTSQRADQVRVRQARVGAVGEG